MAEHIVRCYTQDANFIDDWKEVGGASYGDYYRQYLINPIIYELLRSDSDFGCMIYEAYAKWYFEFGGKNTTAWYDEWKSSVKKTSILDLGCGEGYRGRWLGQNGFQYHGVDVSAKMLDGNESGEYTTYTVKDLDQLNPLQDVWKEFRPPNWIFAITLLDQLESPEYLLADIAKLYKNLEQGFMLAVTCNPEFYYYTGEEVQPVDVNIATFNKYPTQNYIRSRQKIRKLFRDAGMNVIDEASPHLPVCFVERREHSIEDYNVAHAPFIFWLVEISSTEREYITRNDLQKWLSELTQQSTDAEKLMKKVLDVLSEHKEKLFFRKFKNGQYVIRLDNIGGRLFVVRNGVFEAQFPRDNKSQNPILRKTWSFHQNEIFGDLEIENNPNKEVVRYPTNIVVIEEDCQAGHAKVLEISASLVQETMMNESLLGNPFFEQIRGKVLDELLYYNNRIVPDYLLGLKNSQRIIKFSNPSGDFTKLEVKYVVALASLILQYQNEERKHRNIARVNLVFISGFEYSIKQTIGTTVKDLNAYNVAARFLEQAGIVREMRVKKSEGKAKHISNKTKEFIATQPWVKRLSQDKREAFYYMVKNGDGARYFFIDDELELRRCVAIPSAALFKRLVDRIQLAPASEVTDAKTKEFEQSIVTFLRRHFMSNRWGLDSYGNTIKKGQFQPRSETAFFGAGSAARGGRVDMRSFLPKTGDSKPKSCHAQHAVMRMAAEEQKLSRLSATHARSLARLRRGRLRGRGLPDFLRCKKGRKLHRTHC